MFSFPLQSEPRMIQLILKDISIWSKTPYLNSTDCPDYITIDYSWRLDTTSDVGTGRGELNPIQLTLKPVATSTKQLWWPASLLAQHAGSYWLHHRDATAFSPESANIPAGKLPHADIPRGSTMLPLWMSYSCVNHLYTHEQLQTRPQMYRHQKQKAYF